MELNNSVVRKPGGIKERQLVAVERFYMEKPHVTLHAVEHSAMTSERSFVVMVSSMTEILTHISAVELRLSTHHIILAVETLFTRKRVNVVEMISLIQEHQSAAMVLLGVALQQTLSVALDLVAR